VLRELLEHRTTRSSEPAEEILSHPTTVLALVVACAALPAAVASQTVAIPDVTIVDGLVPDAEGAAGAGEARSSDLDSLNARNALRSKKAEEIARLEPLEAAI
jgi:hypothetical protein